MKEELISLEADFANNDYFGTNVWTEEKYRVERSLSWQRNSVS